jgi:hypothetical protein
LALSLRVFLRLGWRTLLGPRLRVSLRPLRRRLVLWGSGARLALWRWTLGWGRMLLDGWTLRARSGRASFGTGRRMSFRSRLWCCRTGFGASFRPGFGFRFGPRFRSSFRPGRGCGFRPGFGSGLSVRGKASAGVFDRGADGFHLRRLDVVVGDERTSGNYFCRTAVVD